MWQQDSDRSTVVSLVPMPWLHPSSCSAPTETCCCPGLVSTPRPCCVGCGMLRCSLLLDTCLCWRRRPPTLWPRLWRWCALRRRAVRSSSKCCQRCRTITDGTCSSGWRNTARMMPPRYKIHLGANKIHLGANKVRIPNFTGFIHSSSTAYPVWSHGKLMPIPGVFGSCCKFPVT